MRLHDYLDYRAACDPESEFATTGARTVSCAQAAEWSDRLACSLVQAGVAAGTRVAYLSKNAIEFGLAYFAASKAGVVLVPLNYRLVPREWATIVDDAAAEIVFAETEFTAGVDSVRDRLSSVQRWVCVDGDAAGWELLGECLKRAQVEPGALADRACDDVYQMYTSGTTGRPKGVVISQQALLCTLMQWRLALALHPHERALVVAPMYHASGALTLFHAVASTASIYLVRDFDAQEVGRILDEDHIGYAMLVPAMILAIIQDDPAIERREFANLRSIMYGGSAISETTLRSAIEVFGCELIQSFGMTEMPNVVYLTAEDHLRALRGRPELLLAAGRPGPGSSVKIVDEDDAELPHGTIGEICGRGGQVMSRYWNLPGATAEALRGGWMHTGDAGYVDEEGYLFVKDRIKDMICTGGENVYPREVEDVLFEHPAVADAAVIGVPSDRWGETVHGVVVVRTGCELQADELVKFCVGRIAGFKRPRSVSFIDEIPRNPSGKVLKRELRVRTEQPNGAQASGAAPSPTRRLGGER
jgi:acyl-CoA synthetase (AMP-forming)/AMP-acid ligase II